MTSPSKKASVLRVEAAIRAAGFTNEVVELKGTARSAKEAAEALGCEVGQIVKSLVFRGAVSGEPVLVVASGTNRVDEAKIEALVSESLEKPDARFVREKTGFSIGGVPPIGHAEPFTTFMDEDLFGYGEVWAAAGHTHAVFALSPEELAEMTRGKVVSVRPDEGRSV